MAKNLISGEKVEVKESGNNIYLDLTNAYTNNLLNTMDSKDEVIKDYADGRINGTVLYENVSGTSSDFVISDTYTNYKFIEVTIADDNNKSQQVVKFDTKYTDSVCAIIYVHSSSTVITIYNTRIKFSGTNATLSGHSIAFNSSGIPGFANAVQSKIYKVVGYN